METPKPGRYKKSAVAVAIVGVIVGLLWAQGHYQVALVVLSGLCLVVLISALLTVATLREQVSENEFAALHDPLTELPNRLLFHDRVHQALLAARRSGSRAAVIMLDVDHFKEINDSLGHHTGDLVLYEVGRRLTETLRVSDSVARLNGDEFAVLLPEVDDDLSAAAAATKVREALAVPFPVEQLEVEMEATVGIALYPDHGEDPETLLQHAEVAMYNAKHSHSGHELYAAARDEFSPDSLRLVGELRRGISNGELELHYQPKVRAERQGGRGRRGAGALAASGARPDVARELHPARRAHRPDPPAHARGPGDGTRPGRLLAQGRARARRGREPVAAQPDGPRPAAPDQAAARGAQPPGQPARARDHREHDHGRPQARPRGP